MSRLDLPRRRHRRPLLSLALAAAALGAVGGPSAVAQDAPVTGETLFGQYQLEARGTGVQARYEIEGLLPGGSPVLDLTLPETLARFSSGPTGYGLASLAYPGGVLVNLGSLISQSGADGSMVPDYPIKAEAFFPAGPTEVFSNQGGGEQRVQTDPLGVEAVGAFPAVDATPVVKVGSIRSGSRSSIEDGQAVARTRVELGNVSILGGVITIDALVTDLVAAHDGSAGAAAGGTRATGVRFLGLAADLTEDGLVLAEAPEATGPAGPLGSLLDPALAPLQELTAPVRALLADVLDQATPSLNGVLEAAGLQVHLLAGAEPASSTGAAGRASSGLALEFRYEGKQQQALVDLLNSVPAELRPSLGPLPNPTAFLVENHIAGITLGTGTVMALASAPFTVDDLGGGSVDPGAFDAGSSLPPLGEEIGFDTGVPPIPRSPGVADLGGASETAMSTAATAGLVLALLLIGSPLFALMSTRLADNVLMSAATSCPSGLDQPQPPARPS